MFIKVGVILLIILHGPYSYLFCTVQYVCLLKGSVHTALVRSLTQQQPTREALSNVISVVNGNEYRPDVGVWDQLPGFLQSQDPVIYTSPPPNLWIEGMCKSS